MDGSTDTEEVVQIGQGYITFKPKTCHHGKPGIHYTVTYTVKRLLPAWTEIVLEANYNVKFGWLGLLRYIFQVSSTERRLHLQFEQVLEGIDYHLTTNKRVRKCAGTNKIATSLSNHIKVAQRQCSQAVGTI